MLLRTESPLRRAVTSNPMLAQLGATWDNSDNLRPAPGPDLARRGGGECEDCANYAATLHFRYFYRSVIADRWDSWSGWNCCRAVLVQHCDSRSKSYDVYLGAIKMSVLGSSARLSQHKDRDQAKHQAVPSVQAHWWTSGQIFPDCHPRLASPRCCLSDCSGGESVEMLLAITKRTVSF